MLNRVLAAEYESLLPRLKESDPWVSLNSADDGAELIATVRDAESNVRELNEMILDLRGAPVSRRAATASSSVHYVNLSYLMPAILADLRRLISIYESAAGTTGHRQADALLSRILENYRRHLAALDKIHPNQALSA